MPRNGVTIFFSHTGRDRDWCEWLAREAESMGVRAYLAEHDARPGEPLAEKVKRHIRGSNAFVVLLTENTAGSTYVHQEIGVAVDQGKLVIPLVQPGAGRHQLAMLDGTEYISFDFRQPHTGKENFAAALRRLAEKQRKQDEVETLIALGLVFALLVFVLRDGGPGFPSPG
jgi:hypothetical protein